MKEKSERLKKLEQQQERIKLAMQRERSKLAGQARKDDTRRKILVGAVMLTEAEKDPELHKRIMDLLKKSLKRADDFTLFGLFPPPDNENAPETRAKESLRDAF